MWPAYRSGVSFEEGILHVECVDITYISSDEHLQLRVGKMVRNTLADDIVSKPLWFFILLAANVAGKGKFQYFESIPILFHSILNGAMISLALFMTYSGVASDLSIRSPSVALSST